MSVNLYRVQTSGTAGGSGSHHWFQVGTPVTVDGTPMVRMSYGSIVPAEGWSATVNEAAQIGAAEIEEMARKLLVEAELLRGKTEATP